MSNVWYGSLTNRISEMAVKGQPEPVIGMGATITGYSDRHAATIIAVEKLKGDRFRIVVQQDTATRTDNKGMCESQNYTFTANPNGSKSTYQQDGKGRWRQAYLNEATGRWKMVDGSGLRIGERDEYYDFSF